MKKIKKNNKTCFVCQTCFFVYKDKEIAEQCEAYCVAHNACNTEITRHAVGSVKEEEVKEKEEQFIFDDEE